MLVSNWAIEAWKWAVGKNVINGTNGKLNPQGTATRDVAASVIYKYFKTAN